MRRCVLVASLLVGCAAAASGQPQPKPRWQPIEFLFGDWIAKGSGEPGAAAGEASFRPELDGRIVVRRSSADYRPSGGEKHEDLLIIDGSMKAIYFDSEGHVIHYSVTAPASNTAVFESEASDPGPRVRLTYRLDGQQLLGKFELAPTGSTEYKTYREWTSSKKAR